MRISNLQSIPFDHIISCFLEAFSDYFVSMPDDPEYYRSRWEASGVRYDLSFGAFHDGKLVAFIIHCVTNQIAFNTGTGVIPAFRGQRIVSSIYQHALPELADHNIKMSKLEVITRNQTAIKIYQQVGFRITRTYHCFRGNINPMLPVAQLKRVDVTELVWETIPNRQNQSWDHQERVLIDGPYEYYLAFVDQKLIGVIGINTSFGYVALLELMSQDDTSWGPLLSALANLSPWVKINNVDQRLEGKVQALKACGLENPIDQYEMELVIS